MRLDGDGHRLSSPARSVGRDDALRPGPSRCGPASLPGESRPRNRRSSPSTDAARLCPRAAGRATDREAAAARSNCRSASAASAVKAGHAHQALDADVGELARRSTSGSTSAGSKPPLLSSPEMFTSTSAGTWRPAAAASSSRAASSRGLSTEWNSAIAGKRPAKLVALHVADEVPADRQIGQRFGLGPQLLGPAFAQIVAACGHQRRGPGGRDVFGHRHQRHRVGRLGRWHGRPPRSLADASQVFGQARPGLPAKGRSFDFDPTLDGAVADGIGPNRNSVPRFCPSTVRPGGGPASDRRAIARRPIWARKPTATSDVERSAVARPRSVAARSALAWRRLRSRSNKQRGVEILAPALLPQHQPVFLGGQLAAPRVDSPFGQRQAGAPTSAAWRRPARLRGFRRPARRASPRPAAGRSRRSAGRPAALRAGTSSPVGPITASAASSTRSLREH